MNNDQHDHDEMSSKYCPVCGEKIQQTPVTDTLEQLPETFREEIHRIYVNRDTAQKIHDEKSLSTTRLSESVSHLDAPVYHTRGSTPADITIIHQAGSSSHYRSMKTLSLKKAQKRVNQNQQTSKKPIPETT